MAIQGESQAPVLAQVPSTATSIEALQAQVANLSEQLVGLRAQRDVLGRQVQGPPNPRRAQIESQRSDLGGQITQTEMALESARAQLAARLGVQSYQIGPKGTVVVQPNYGGRRNPDPDMVVGLSFLLLLAVVLPASIAYARRIWRGNKKEAPATKMEESPGRLDHLEHAVDAIALEIERVAEGQRFVTKILAERPPMAASAPPAVAQPHNRAESGIAEPKPFLALGAGPIEPIRVPERQAVRQSITPH